MGAVRRYRGGVGTLMERTSKRPGDVGTQAQCRHLESPHTSLEIVARGQGSEGADPGKDQVRVLLAS